VRNLWLVATASSYLTEINLSEDDRPLGALLHELLAMHETFWTTHAWSSAWNLPTRLADLHRLDQAALTLGACEASGVAPPHWVRLDDVIEQFALSEELDHLQNQRALGARLNLTELSRLLDTA
jgi:hypothetical protein